MRIASFLKPVSGTRLRKTATALALLPFMLTACQSTDDGAASGPQTEAQGGLFGQPANPEPGYAPPGMPEPAQGYGSRVPQHDGDMTAGAHHEGDVYAKPQSNQVQVAMLLPLSGPQGALGRAMQDAAQLALFQVADPNFELIFEDTGGNPDQAAQAAQKVLSRGARLILGPLLSTSVRAVSPLARRAGVNVVAFSTDRTVAGNGIFVMGFLPQAEVERVVSYATTKGLSRYAALAPENAYGRTVVGQYSRAVQRAGGSVSSIAYYDPRATDFTNVVRDFARFDAKAQAGGPQSQPLGSGEDEVAQRARERLQGRGGHLAFDALLIPDGGQRLLTLSPLLTYFKIDPSQVKIMGTGLWDEPVVASEQSLLGGWFAAPEPGPRASFTRQYVDTYGYNPPRLATLAFDSAALAAVLARQGGGRYDFRTLTSPSGFAGVDGIFRFNTDGLIQRGLAVLEVTPDGAKVVDPAPTTFQNLTH